MQTFRGPQAQMINKRRGHYNYSLSNNNFTIDSKHGRLIGDNVQKDRDRVRYYSDRTAVACPCVCYLCTRAQNDVLIWLKNKLKTDKIMFVTVKWYAPDERSTSLDVNGVFTIISSSSRQRGSGQSTRYEGRRRIPAAATFGVRGKNACPANRCTYECVTARGRTLNRTSRPAGTRTSRHRTGRSSSEHCHFPSGRLLSLRRPSTPRGAETPAYGRSITLARHSLSFFLSLFFSFSFFSTFSPCPVFTCSG